MSWRKPSRSGIHKLVTGGRAHHKDLSSAGIHRRGADSEGGTSFEDHKDLVVRMLRKNEALDPGGRQRLRTR